MATVVTPAEPLVPEEFTEAKQQAEEDDLEHLIQEFQTAGAYNAYVAASKANGSVDVLYELKKRLGTYETLGKAAGLWVLFVLAYKGAKQALRGY